MNDKNLLLVDAGNTNIKFGIAVGDREPVSYALSTAQLGTSDSLGFAVLEMCRLAGVTPESLEAWVVSSVVPGADEPMRVAASRYCGCQVFFANKDLPIPMENRYERPQEVGADRLVSAYGAVRLFDSDGFIVIDFGTATTFDLVKGNAYLGGLICPGVLSSARGLAAGTAKLPQADLSVSPDVINVGRTTAQSLSQGLLHGFASMTEGLCARLSKQFDTPPKVVATGGFAGRIARAARCVDVVRPDLLLEGLRLAYDANK
ncbi:MAG: type III pantothenate kinase [Desulfovibrio sp.]|uniref:type III pantothenate kinase n=1 Tax=Desulfovibrio sp. 7SRBS1 TaxID=3378064 RepID=UPI003B3FBD61